MDVAIGLPNAVPGTSGEQAAFEGAGCQELFLFPSSSDPQQVDLLADAAGL
ncbi:MAG TPA: hypothetical protein VFI17_10325 [Solirubrobacterales bacterium]|nr:hypothetical protein [Solirubrobacterales bacterium]